MARTKEPPKMIKIQGIKVTEETLTLDYRVSNPFDDDIQVCHDTGVYGNQEVQHATTRIYGQTVWIILGLNAEKSAVFSDPRPVAKYVRLPSGESCSGRIVLRLPIRDRFRERQERHKDHKETLFRRAVFDLGYFGPKLNKFFDALSEMDRMDGIKPKPIVRGPYYYLEVSPLITKEVLDGKRREVIYAVGLWTSEKNEESETIEITNVEIPCFIVVEDE